MLASWMKGESGTAQERKHLCCQVDLTVKHTHPVSDWPNRSAEHRRLLPLVCSSCVHSLAATLLQDEKPTAQTCRHQYSATLRLGTGISWQAKSIFPANIKRVTNRGRALGKKRRYNVTGFSAGTHVESNGSCGLRRDVSGHVPRGPVGG
ncbi:uncharacterized protein BKA78DRAFT_53792 [Phyllosticta capitalensis]|uniref:uncharacterized protein n=1 Tax=Phyllosticta capitalensis TaxID=121624 RepID=UPI00313107EA